MKEIRIVLLLFVLAFHTSATVTFAISWDAIAEIVSSAISLIGIDGFNADSSLMNFTYFNPSNPTIIASNFRITSFTVPEGFELNTHIDYNKIYFNCNYKKTIFEFDWKYIESNVTDGWCSMQLWARPHVFIEFSKSVDNLLDFEIVSYGVYTDGEFLDVRVNDENANTDLAFSYFRDELKPISESFLSTLLLFYSKRGIEKVAIKNPVWTVKGTTFTIDYSILSVFSEDRYLMIETKGEFLSLASEESHSKSLNDTPTKEFTVMATSTPPANVLRHTPQFQSSTDSLESIYVKISESSFASLIQVILQAPVSYALFPSSLSEEYEGILSTEYLDYYFPGLLQAVGVQDLYFVCFGGGWEDYNPMCEFRSLTHGKLIEIYQNMCTMHDVEIEDWTLYMLRGFFHCYPMIVRCYFNVTVDVLNSQGVIELVNQIMRVEYYFKPLRWTGNAFELPLYDFLEIEDQWISSKEVDFTVVSAEIGLKE